MYIFENISFNKKIEKRLILSRKIYMVDNFNDTKKVINLLILIIPKLI